MEKMWSPWRSVYIESFKDKKEDEKCVFCAAQKEDINDERSLKVFEGKTAFIVMNLYPYNNGHLMVVPRRHLSDYSDLTKEERYEVADLIDLAIRALREVSSPHGFNVGANLGRAAGAGIDQHMHFHIVPRWSGDTNFMPVLGEVKVISQELLRTKKALIEVFDKLTASENA
jgi:ATP adenylyltransferase